jgi:hypothetical protein
MKRTLKTLRCYATAIVLLVWAIVGVIAPQYAGTATFWKVMIAAGIIIQVQALAQMYSHRWGRDRPH